LWLDQLDAMDRVSSARARGQISDGQEAAARDLIESGFTVIRNVAPAILCDQVADDFTHYLREHAEYAAKCVDAQGRHLRFVNFHGVSDAALELGNTPQIMLLLDFLFARSAGLYTSLLFEYGSQQPIHRDSPFFHTFPINYFFGVWFALEDIHPDSGPLMYVPGGHRFQVNHHMIFEQLKRQNPQQSTKELLDRALEHYYGAIIAEAEKVAPPCSVVLKKGDCAIWHPMLPHGGTKANNPMLTRKSIVFHCAPIDVQVYQQDVFFTADNQPPPRYGFREFRERQYAMAGRPCFQGAPEESSLTTWMRCLVNQLLPWPRNVTGRGTTPLR
jgi:ectoine hydroxylase-related dioxygenase (phytanoyl-CoA dioxygenase family)